MSKFGVRFFVTEKRQVGFNYKYCKNLRVKIENEYLVIFSEFIFVL